ncbi:acetolactate synthase, large subunit [Propionispora hippei DSM 15287]|uniref:Acetolactate synthase n=2 Tax=Propionispora TaxID=112902 RepID=A0A1M6FNI1_9FIRM|nr:acetolactate synthase, large subunit [Propionispora hippei DSM 15287]
MQVEKEAVGKPSLAVNGQGGIGMKISGAEAVIRCLLEQGVDTVFGYPGGTVLPLYDALCDSPALKHVLTVHEQGAAHAADGYARASGRVGVCIATSGPGATNLITGLAAAYMDSIPVVAITGQVATGVIGQDAFQEIDIVGMTMAITKHNFQVKDVQKLPEIIRYAFHIARGGRPGPVLVDIPRDIQSAKLDFYEAPPSPGREWQVPGGMEREFREAGAIIQEARRPVIIVGGGVIQAEAGAEVLALAEKCRLPVVSTLMGLGAFPASRPRFLGLTGLHGHKAANSTIHYADTILAVGCRFSDRVTGDRRRYGEQKSVIHIDVDPAEIDKNVMTHIGLPGDLKKILSCITEYAQPGPVDKWLNTIRSWQEEFAPVYSEASLNAPWIMQHMAEETAGQEFVFATDVGQHQMWAAQHLKLEKPRTWLTSGGLGAMGYGLPAAMGAQFAVPGKRVIHIAGDGGMKMTGNELYTIAAHCLPIISVIINNSGLGMIRQMQHALYNKRYSACCLPPTVDFTLYAKSFGVDSVAVNTAQEFKGAFAQALASRRPHVIVANIAKTDFVTPMAMPGSTLNNYIELE